MEKETTPTGVRDFLESLIVTVILALFVTTFVVQAFKIPSSSMEGTLLVGDHLLVNKLGFSGVRNGWNWVLPYRTIRRGDIIVFKYPEQPHPHFVKRAIGLPGDRLRIEDRQVFINGVPLEESYAIHDQSLPLRLSANFPPPTPAQGVYLDEAWRAELEQLRQGDEIVLPAGKYFALGDNRDNSRDSRYWGLVDRSSVIGRPLFIYWSVAEEEQPWLDRRDDAGGWETPFALVPTWLSRTRWGRFFHWVR